MYILSWVWKIWTLEYKLKKRLFSSEMDFQRRAARTSRLLKVRNKVVRENMLVIQISCERMENYVLKWYGHVV